MSAAKTEPRFWLVWFSLDGTDSSHDARLPRWGEFGPYMSRCPWVLQGISVSHRPSSGSGKVWTGVESVYGTLYPQKIQDHSRLRNTFGYPRKYPLFPTHVPDNLLIPSKLTHAYPHRTVPLPSSPCAIKSQATPRPSFPISPCASNNGLMANHVRSRLTSPYRVPKGP